MTYPRVSFETYPNTPPKAIYQVPPPTPTSPLNQPETTQPLSKAFLKIQVLTVSMFKQMWTLIKFHSNQTLSLLDNKSASTALTSKTRQRFFTLGTFQLDQEIVRRQIQRKEIKELNAIINEFKSDFEKLRNITVLNNISNLNNSKPNK